MNCAKCGSRLADDSTRCEHCGVDLARAQPQLSATQATGAAKEGSGPPAPEIKPTTDWGFVLDREFDRLYVQFKKEEELSQEQGKKKTEPEAAWGGFIRRAFAFLIDLVVLLCLSLLLTYSSYVAYQVGLAAYDRAILDDPLPLVGIFLFGYLFVAAGYFVLFHGMDGRTIGKWLFGLRVVDRNQGPITYSQAFVRFIGYLLSAFFGLGFLWVMVNRKKRGWHDLLARTWVIRESSFDDKGK